MHPSLKVVRTGRQVKPRLDCARGMGAFMVCGSPVFPAPHFVIHFVLALVDEVGYKVPERVSLRSTGVSRQPPPKKLPAPRAHTRAALSSPSLTALPPGTGEIYFKIVLARALATALIRPSRMTSA